MNNKTSLRFPILTLAFALAACAGASAEEKIYDTKADGREQIAHAVKQAKTEGKHVLVTWGANWCGWCHHLKAQCENDKRISKLLDEAFVSIRIDLGHRDKHMDLAREYDLEFHDLYIPHMTVLDGEGKILGDKNPEDLAVDAPDGSTRDRIYSQDRIFEFLEANRPDNATEDGNE